VENHIHNDARPLPTPEERHSMESDLREMVDGLMTAAARGKG